MKLTYLTIVAALFTAPSALAVPASTAPFQVNGTTVTTPGATGSYNPAYFDDSSLGYHVSVAPSSGMLTLTNTDRVINVGDGSVVSISAGSTLHSTTDTAIYVTGSGNVTNAGSLISNGGDGITINNSTATANTVVNSGAIQADSFGIGIDGGFASSNSVTNTGIVDGGFQGIYVFGYMAGHNTIVSSGTVNSDDNALHISGSGAISNTITNSGTVTSFNNDGIYIDADNGGETNSITNSGTVTADNLGIRIYGAVAISNTITNSGTVTGNEALSILGYGAGTNTIVNSGNLTSTSDQGIDIEAYSGGEVNKITNTGTVHSADVGIEINGSNAASNLINNSASVTSDYGNVLDIIGSGAGSNTIINSGALTTVYGQYGIFISAYSGGEINSITNSGTIHSGDAGIYIYGLNAAANTIQNAAAITSDFDQAIFLDGQGAGSNTIINSGALSAVNDNGIYLEASNGGEINSVNNSGSITAGFDGIDIYGENADTNTLINSGTIVTTYGEGLYLDGYNTNANTITNSGAITANDDTAIYLESGSGGEVNKVTNSGTLNAYYSGIYVYGENADTNLISNTGAITADQDQGIYLDGYNTNASTILNSGSIVSMHDNGIELSAEDGGGANLINNSGAISARRDGIRLSGSGSGSNTLINTGTVVGRRGSGIRFDGSDSDTNTLFNSGSVTGRRDGIRYTGSSFGTDTITLQGGAVNGSSHSVRIYSGNGVTVNVVARVALNNDIRNTGPLGTLNLQLVGLTPGQLADFNSQIGATSGSIVLSPTYTYTWSNLTLTGSAVSLEQVANPGLRGLATLIDNAGQSLPLDFDAFYLAALGDPNGALDVLSGRAVTAAENNIAFNFTTQMHEEVTSRAANLAYGSGGLDTAGLRINDASRLAMANTLQQQLGSLSLLGGTQMISDSKDESKTMTSEPANRWGAWLSGTAEFADQETTSGNLGYNYTTASPTIGLDYRICPDFVLGALFNYANSSVNFSNGGTLGVNTEFAGLYGVYAHKGLRISSMAGYGFNQYDSSRQAFGSIAQSSPNGNEVTAGFTAAYDFKVGRHFVLSPEVGLDYTHLSVDSFSETGAGAFNLNVGQRDADSLRSHLGGRMTATFDCGPLTFMPQVNAAWYHEFMDDSNGASTSIAGAPAIGSFFVSQDTTERDFALVGAGLSVIPKGADNVTIFLNYNAQVGQNNFMANIINGGVRVGF